VNVTVKARGDRPASTRRAAQSKGAWSEVLDAEGKPRPLYQSLLARLESLPRAELRLLDHRMEASLRELGAGPSTRAENAPAWTCDLLPHIFEEREWARVTSGLRQRMKAFELFLADVHGAREILRSGTIPIGSVLGSPFFQRAAVGLPPSRGAYLHLGSISLKRGAGGELQIGSQHFGRVHGLARMVQNRRLLARVAPELFRDRAVASIAHAPVALLEALRQVTDAAGSEPVIVLLSPGPASPFYSEDGFLARRMGVPLVQGRDMLVLDDRVYLKTIAGLQRVHAILSSVSERYLDPLALDGASEIGVPGLVHCLRMRTVALVNSLGSQLADDRSLLCFGGRIIRYYLGEAPLLPTVQTFWLGDVDQREVVLADLSEYRILPLHGDAMPGAGAGAREDQSLRQEIRRAPHLFVAQPAAPGATTISLEEGRRVERRLDHLVYALRREDVFEVFPGALTRLAPGGSHFIPSALGGASKDSWVPVTVADAPPASEEAKRSSQLVASHRAPGGQVVTSRVAESLYWLGRYLERANNLAYLLQVVETLEVEELNSSERKLYRPVWNGLLPPLEGSNRRSVASRRERYRLVLEPTEPGALVNVLKRCRRNAESVQDILTPEVWGVLSELQALFERNRYNASLDDDAAARVTRRLAEATTRAAAAFAGLATSTMLADDALRFCQLGQQLERAILTANATLACPRAFTATPTRETEIELSAFLRLQGTRDNYRRIYQIRAEPLPVLELLWQSAEAPRSVLLCLTTCARILRETYPQDDDRLAVAKPSAAVDALVQRLHQIDWRHFFRPVPKVATDSAADLEEAPPVAPNTESLLQLLKYLARGTMEVHNAIADSFLNHQIRIAPPPRASVHDSFDYGI
jgi:uncharacterized circularly permuted ATP-grasp superfamily protein/uncharacterized alpha-E superfamily protein